MILALRFLSPSVESCRPPKGVQGIYCGIYRLPFFEMVADGVKQFACSQNEGPLCVSYALRQFALVCLKEGSLI
jgi:hypothetical protein